MDYLLRLDNVGKCILQFGCYLSVLEKIWWAYSLILHSRFRKLMLVFETFPCNSFGTPKLEIWSIIHANCHFSNAKYSLLTKFLAMAINLLHVSTALYSITLKHLLGISFDKSNWLLVLSTRFLGFSKMVSVLWVSTLFQISSQ